MYSDASYVCGLHMCEDLQIMQQQHYYCGEYIWIWQIAGLNYTLFIIMMDWRHMRHGSVLL